MTPFQPPHQQNGAKLQKTRTRLMWVAGGFSFLFFAVAVKLAIATVIFPSRPKPQPERPDPRDYTQDQLSKVQTGHQLRATITDRNGQILAISLPTAALYADPREIIDPVDVANRVKKVLTDLDVKEAAHRMASAKQFVYLDRQITSKQELEINDLGIPGLYFEQTEKRYYPMGRVAAQVMGGTDIDGKGVAGVEKAFNKRLKSDPTPLRLSIDVRVQAVMRDELEKSMTMFTAIGACGIVMDVRTGEVIAMVSLPDYDANKFGDSPADDRFNRAVTGMFEPGSTFKLQTASMAIDDHVVNIWDTFDAAHNIHMGRFTITDFEGKHRMLYFPEVLAYSSNLGAAHMASEVGAERQRAWLRNMGMFNRVGIQLPEAGIPIVPPASGWKELTTMTVGFGHGIAVSPLHVVRGTAAIANGGVLMRPTILDMDGEAPPEGRRVMKQSTSDLMRRMMRLVVTAGYGKPADIPGYFVGGKTGTAEKTGAHGYKKHANVSAFMSVFPMNAPRYAVYFMLDEPHGTKATGGFSTAGAVSAPGAGRVIQRIAPMLGLFPQIQNMKEIQDTLNVPLQPPHGMVLDSDPMPASEVPPTLPGESVPPPPPTPVAPTADDAHHDKKHHDDHEHKEDEHHRSDGEKSRSKENRHDDAARNKMVEPSPDEDAKKKHAAVAH